MVLGFGNDGGIILLLSTVGVGAQKMSDSVLPAVSLSLRSYLRDRALNF